MNKMNTINKLVNEGMKQCNIQKMLQHFENFNFMKYNKGRMILGYNGENVKQTIHNEWLMSNLVTCDEPAFLSSCVGKCGLKNAFNEVEPIVKDLPCSIVSSCKVDSPNQISFDSETYAASDIFIKCFSRSDGILLQRYIICETQASDNFFYKLQRVRQKWWKKFSASPGQFSLTQAFSAEGRKYVDIQVQFPWGPVAVEKIQFLPDFLKRNKQSGNKVSASVNVVSSETILEKTAIALICDAYESSEQTGKQVLRFHRKLAPYKVAISSTPSTPEDERNLKELALLLSKQIRKTNNSVLLLPDFCSVPVEEQITRNDSLGIPYTVILTAKTLKTGLLEIRSRDTTLKEQSHVGSLAPYVEKLMKNY